MVRTARPSPLPPSGGAPITVVVVDDEPLSRARLVTLLGREPNVVIVAECADGVQALDAITAVSPDLVFLDVQMPELDGLGVLDALEAGPIRADPEVIFVTAYDAYMERAFEVHAVDYLRKPYTDARFAAALAAGRRRVLARRREQRDADQNVPAPDASARAALRPVLDDTRAHRLAESDGRVVVWNRRRGTWTFLAPEAVDAVSADGDRQVVVRAGGESFAWSTTLRDAEQRLGPELFMRVHRSWLVNRSSVRQVKALTKGEYALTLADGTVLDTGRTYRQIVEAFVDGR